MSIEVFSMNNPSLSEFQIALGNFRKNRFALFSVYIIFILYAAAIFADFLSPYSYKNEDRKFSYCPPTKIQVIDHGKISWPFIYGVQLTFDEYHRRVYKINEKKKYPLHFFSRGDEYKFLGIVPGDRKSVV